MHAVFWNSHVWQADMIEVINLVQSQRSHRGEGDSGDLGESSEEKIALVQAPCTGMRLQPVPEMPHRHPLGYITLPAVWI